MFYHKRFFKKLEFHCLAIYKSFIYLNSLDIIIINENVFTFFQKNIAFNIKNNFMSLIIVLYETKPRFSIML